MESEHHIDTEEKDSWEDDQGWRQFNYGGWKYQAEFRQN